MIVLFRDIFHLYGVHDSIFLKHRIKFSSFSKIVVIRIIMIVILQISLYD